MMKKLLPLLAFLLFFVPSRASHFLGGDIEYKLTGTKTWKIRLTLYRDCSAADVCSGPCGSACTVSMYARPASPAATAPYSNSGCNPSSYTLPITLNLVKVEDSELQATALCPSSRKNFCDNMGCTTPGSFTPGVEKYIFEGTLNLTNPLFPAGCVFWEVFWESCCRNPNISTIQSPGGAGFRIGTIININEGTTLANNRSNSPILGNEPFIMICGGQEYYYNMGATDPDGDSLSYLVVPSLIDGGTPVTYVAPYTFSNPLPYNSLTPTITSPTGGFTCDTFNGDINFVPISVGTIPFVGIMAVQIKQWRRNASGQPLLVGITQRDLQVWIFSCPNNNTPRFRTSPNGVFNRPLTKWTIAQGDSLCFDIIGTDTDYVPPMIIDSTRLFIDTIALRMMAGATFTPNYTGDRSNGPREDSYRFCWKPQSTQARDLPYFFSVTAYDSRCPMPGRIAQSFAITVLPHENLTPISKTFAGCNRYNLSTSKTGSVSNGVITWKISTKAGQQNLDSNYVIRTGATLSSFAFNGKGKFVISAYLQYPNNNVQSVMYDTIVVDSFITINKPSNTFSCSSGSFSTTLKLSSSDSSVKYKWSINGTSVSTTDSLTRTYANNTNIIVQATLGTCSVTDTISVFPQATPLSTLADSLVLCHNSTINADINTPPVTYLWNTGSTERSIKPTASGVYWVKMINMFGCSLTDTVKIFKYDSVYASAGPDTTLCIGTEFHLVNNGVGKNSWSYNGSVALGANPYVKPISAASYILRVEPANATTTTTPCTARDTVRITVKGGGNVDLADTSRLCYGTNAIIGRNTPAAGVKYLWSTGDTTSSITVANDGTYIITANHVSSGCSISDTTLVLVNPSLHVYAGNDTTICSGNQVLLKGQGNGVLQWNVLGFVNNPATDAPNRTRSYVLRATQQAVNNTTCTQYDTLVANVLPSPENTLANTLTICTGNAVPIGNNKPVGNKFIWNTGDTTSYIWVRSAGMYSFTVTAPNGCVITDTCIVTENNVIANAGSDTSICMPAVTISRTSNAASGNQWFILPSANVASAQRTYSFTPAIGLTKLMLKVTQTINGTTCSNTDTVNINLNPRPQLGTRPAITEACAGNTVPIPTYPVVSGGTGKWVYAFNPNAIDANNNTVNTSLLKTQPSGTGTATNWIIFNYTSDSGCTAIDSVAIKTYGRPAINRNVSKRFFCETDQPVTAASVFNYTPAGGTWSGNGFTTTNNTDYFDPQGFTAYPAASIGTYNYTYTYANTSFTCDVSDTINAYVLARPEIGTISGNTNPFENSTELYTITNPSSATHQWLFQGEAQVINTTNTQAEIKWGNAGAGQIKVIATSAGQCINSDSISIHIQQTVGVKEPAVFRNLQLFPNPVQSVINIISPAQTSEPMTIRLFDAAGKSVMEKTITAENGTYDAVLHVNHLNNGTYFISISIDSQQVQRKVSITK